MTQRKEAILITIIIAMLCLEIIVHRMGLFELGQWMAFFKYLLLAFWAWLKLGTDFKRNIHYTLAILTFAVAPLLYMIFGTFSQFRAIQVGTNVLFIVLFIYANSEKSSLKLLFKKTIKLNKRNFFFFLVLPWLYFFISIRGSTSTDYNLIIVIMIIMLNIWAIQLLKIADYSLKKNHILVGISIKYLINIIGTSLLFVEPLQISFDLVRILNVVFIYLLISGLYTYKRF